MRADCYQLSLQLKVMWESHLSVLWIPLVNNKSVSDSDFAVFTPVWILRFNVDRKRAESEQSNVACLEKGAGNLQGKTIHINVYGLIYDISFPEICLSYCPMGSPSNMVSVLFFRVSIREQTSILPNIHPVHKEGKDVWSFHA